MINFDDDLNLNDTDRIHSFYLKSTRTLVITTTREAH